MQPSLPHLPGLREAARYGVKAAAGVGQALCGKDFSFVNDFDNHKWPAVVFFLTCGLFFFGCVWYLWAGASNPDYYWKTATADARDLTEPVLKQNAQIVLAKDQGAQVEGARIVYRGRDHGTLHMELYILQLDPHYAYPHAIEGSQARKGFQLGSHHFRVLAASDTKISLERL